MTTPYTNRLALGFTPKGGALFVVLEIDTMVIHVIIRKDKAHNNTQLLVDEIKSIGQVVSTSLPPTPEYRKRYTGKLVRETIMLEKAKIAFEMLCPYPIYEVPEDIANSQRKLLNTATEIISKHHCYTTSGNLIYSLEEAMLQAHMARQLYFMRLSNEY